MLFCVDLSAQSYIVLEGDTIYGEVLVQLGHKKFSRCTFRAEAETEFKDYSPLQVSAYGVLSEWKYQSFVLPEEAGKAVFMRCLVEGTSSLFVYVDRYFLDSRKDTLVELPLDKYVSDDGERDYQHTSAKLNQIMVSEIIDCPDMASLDRAVPKAIFGITELLKKYHECKNLPFRELQKDRIPGASRLGLVVGGRYEKLGTWSLYDRIPADSVYLDRQYYSHFGLQWIYRPKYAHFPFAFRFGLQLQSFDYTGSYEILTDNSATIGDIEFHRSSSDFIIGLRYSKQFGKLRTFIDGAYKLRMQGTGRMDSILRVNLDTGFEVLEVYTRPEESPNEFGFEIGGGVQLWQFNHFGGEIAAYVGTTGARRKMGYSNYLRMIESRFAFTMYFF